MLQICVDLKTKHSILCKSNMEVQENRRENKNHNPKMFPVYLSNNKKIERTNSQCTLDIQPITKNQEDKCSDIPYSVATFPDKLQEICITQKTY